MLLHQLQVLLLPHVHQVRLLRGCPLPWPPQRLQLVLLVPPAL